MLMHVYIWLQAQDLQARDFSGTADPYAKVRLLPDKTNVWQTRIHKRTLNPGKHSLFYSIILDNINKEK